MAALNAVHEFPCNHPEPLRSAQELNKPCSAEGAKESQGRKDHGIRRHLTEIPHYPPTPSEQESVHGDGFFQRYMF